MSPGMLGISDWGIMIHLFFLHLPTQKRCWSFFISQGRKAREGLDSIFQGEHARCIPHILLLSLFSQPRSLGGHYQPRKNTHKSYIIIPGKTPLTQDCSFFSQLRSQPGTRSCEFPIFSVAPFCIRVYLKKFIFPLKILPS